MKSLILMRHGKAVREHEAPTDHDRPLVERGRSESLATAEWLTGWGAVPDLVLVSDAVRTIQTWQAVRPVLLERNPALTVRTLANLYLAEPEQIWSEVSDGAGTAGCIMVIGHNPGLHQLAMWLSAEAGADDPRVLRHLSEGLPTAAGVVFEAVEDSAPIVSAFRLMALCAPRLPG